MHAICVLVTDLFTAKRQLFSELGWTSLVNGYGILEVRTCSSQSCQHCSGLFCTWQCSIMAQLSAPRCTDCQRRAWGKEHNSFEDTQRTCATRFYSALLSDIVADFLSTLQAKAWPNQVKWPKTTGPAVSHFTAVLSFQSELQFKGLCWECTLIVSPYCRAMTLTICIWVH